MKIVKAEYIISSPSVEKCPEPTLPEIAFIGRSNVGKSSLINMLAGKKELARISSSPGKTQMINHYNINNTMYWVDLPGYGYAKVSIKQRDSWQKMIWNYLELRPNLQTVFVLIDSRHTAQKIDLDFINKLGEKSIAFNIVFTKIDKENQLTVSKNCRDVLMQLKKRWEALPIHFMSSAIKQTGKSKILLYVDSLREEFILE
jgi:GTP-binding protein